MREHAPEQASIMAGKVAAYSGAVTAFTAGLTVTEWGVIVGTVVGVLGLIFGQYWSWRKTSREDAAQAREDMAMAEKTEAGRRREAREALAHAAYLRRLERESSRNTTPMPLDMCANQSDSEQRA